MENTGLAFDKISGDYDRYREAYPADFIATVLETIPPIAMAAVCEIGCGSGQATIRLAELGHSLVCVEPGTNLLGLAEKRLSGYGQASFVNGTFEEAELPNDYFDLVFAANALHWVKPDVRYRKSSEILQPGGHLLASWRWDHPLEGDLGHRLNSILRNEVPGWSVETRNSYEEHALSYFRDLIDSKLFWQCQIRRIPYEFEITGKDYAAWLSTMGNIASLSVDERAKLCERLQLEIEKAGDRLTESGETVIISGRKPW